MILRPSSNPNRADDLRHDHRQPQPQAGQKPGPKPDDPWRWYHRRDQCRGCLGGELTQVLRFPAIPLANDFTAQPEPQAPRYPLTLVRCLDCGLVQVPDVVAPERLFGDYRYLSGASPPLAEHLARQAVKLAQRYRLAPGDLVCEIGANDGTFLAALPAGLRGIGVEPAPRPGDAARGKGVTVWPECFSPAAAARVHSLFGPARLAFAANVFAHVDDPHGFLDGVQSLLAEDGVFVLEVHWFVEMLMHGTFDQIYHELLSYFTLRSLERLLHRAGWRVLRVELAPTHGLSLQVHAVPRHSPLRADPVSGDWLKVRRAESELQLDRPEPYVRFYDEVRFKCDQLREELLQLKAEGRRIAGYGMPAKGNVLLEACGIDRRIVDYVVDSTPDKQHRFTPGTSIPIHPPARLHVDRPDYVLILAWNYADAILRKEAPLRMKGVHMLTPFPEIIVHRPLK